MASLAELAAGASATDAPVPTSTFTSTFTSTSTSPANFVNQAQFEAFVLLHIHPLPQAPLSLKAHQQLGLVFKLAGHQVKKNRGTFQHSVLVQLQKGELKPAQFTTAGIPADTNLSAIGDFFSTQLETVLSGVGATNCISRFANVNSGDDNNGHWHEDKPTSSGSTAKPNTGRVLSYYTCEDKTGALRVRYGKFEVVVDVPVGVSIYVNNVILRAPFQHAHGKSGFNMSIVTEVSAGTMCSADVVSAAQPPLPWHELIPNWNPKAMFLGPKLATWSEWAAHNPVTRDERIRRLAVSVTTGPKGSRGQKRPRTTVKAARSAVDDLSTLQREAAASQQGLLMMASGGMQGITRSERMEAAGKLEQPQLEAAASQQGLLMMASGGMQGITRSERVEAAGKLGQPQLEAAASQQGLLMMASGGMQGITSSERMKAAGKLEQPQLEAAANRQGLLMMASGGMQGITRSERMKAAGKLRQPQLEAAASQQGAKMGQVKPGEGMRGLSNLGTYKGTSTKQAARNAENICKRGVGEPIPCPNPVCAVEIKNDHNRTRSMRAHVRQNNPCLIFIESTDVESTDRSSLSGAAAATMYRWQQLTAKVAKELAGIDTNGSLQK